MKVPFKNSIGILVIILIMLAMMILPLPPFLLDLSFTFNIVFSLMVLLAAIYCKRPLEFGIFPTVLLVVTLLRLSLNIASTRVILLEGYSGTAAAGHVIEAFGQVVIGGNYFVGLIIFTILIIINFVVVTKGAGRISEVSARFTLDAMPGKQMAIDADLNAGLVTQEEAKERRKEITDESDFYGSMDGAGKFVRGDAIAGILILFINILGGLFVGIVQHSLSFETAVHNFTLLTIGDGLVAQIPSLLLSVASAIMVTRVSSTMDMSEQFATQLFSDFRTLIVSGMIMLILGLIPGMPHFVFLGFAMMTFMIGFFLKQKKQSDEKKIKIEEQQKEVSEAQSDTKELNWEDINQVDRIGLEIGYRLISMVDKVQGGKLMGRLKGVRKKLSQELGFLLPAIHVRDNLDLTPNTYRISLSGVIVGQSELYPEKFLAINPGQVFGSLEGIAAKDPAFQLDALWIDPAKKEQAQTLGYTVVDASTVIATHLSQALQQNAANLLGYEETQQLLERLAKKAPKLVEELTPNGLPLGVIVKVLQMILEERIPITDFLTIAETLAEVSTKSKDPEFLAAEVRIALNRLIIQRISSNENELPIAMLNSELEQLLQQALQVNNSNKVGIEPGLAERIQRALIDFTEKQEILGQPAVLLVAPLIRKILSKLVRNVAPMLNILSFQEVPDNKQIKIIGTIG